MEPSVNAPGDFTPSSTEMVKIDAVVQEEPSEPQPAAAVQPSSSAESAVLNPEYDHDEQGIDSDDAFERLVHPANYQEEFIASEDVEDRDQQPLGIVESCFPYLARRGSHGVNSRPHSSHSKGFGGIYPGVKSCFVSVGLMEEDGCSCTTKAKHYEGDVPPIPLEPIHSRQQHSAVVLDGKHVASVD